MPIHEASEKATLQPGTPTPEFQKSQAIRLVDVYFIAPYLMWIGFRAKGLTKIERRILQGIAVSTLVYNARNYALNKRAAGGISEQPQTE